MMINKFIESDFLLIAVCAYYLYCDECVIELLKIYWAFMDKADAMVEPIEEAIKVWIYYHWLACACALAVFLFIKVMARENSKVDFNKIQKIIESEVEV